MKRAQTMPDASFGPIVSFFFLSYIYTEYISCFKATGKAAAMKNGPNNTSGVVWAISKFFSLFSFMFNFQIILMFMEGNDKNGPNDTSGIVWAHSEIFLSFIFLTNISCVLKQQGRWWRQKMAQTMHLASFGPIVSLDFLSCF